MSKNELKIKIENNIVIPNRHENSARSILLNAIEQLEVGESFEFVFDHTNNVRSNMSLVSRNTNRKFITRTVSKNTMRIWRIDDDSEVRKPSVKQRVIKIPEPALSPIEALKSSLRRDIEKMKIGDHLFFESERRERVRKIIQLLLPKKFSYSKYVKTKYQLRRIC